MINAICSLLVLIFIYPVYSCVPTKTPNDHFLTGSKSDAPAKKLPLCNQCKPSSVVVDKSMSIGSTQGVGSKGPIVYTSDGCSAMMLTCLPKNNQLGLMILQINGGLAMFPSVTGIAKKEIYCNTNKQWVPDRFLPLSDEVKTFSCTFTPIG